jgi:DNA/RNA non-specific endonuclease
MSWFRRIVLAVVTSFIAVTLSSPAAALAHVHDALAVARVDVHELGAVRAAQTQLIDLQEESASRLSSARGASTTPSAPVVATDKGSISYGALDDLGRPTGVSAHLTPDMVGTGSPAARSITPPGFGGGSAGHARGHLLGNQLGGSETDARNLVTMFQNPANSPVMRGFENQVRTALDAGQVVNYAATPIYRGSGSCPSASR